MILKAHFDDPRVHARPSCRHVHAGELVIIEALPGPRENDQRGETVVPCAQPPYIALDMGVVPSRLGPIESDDLGQLARPTELPSGAPWLAPSCAVGQELARESRRGHE
jgi:hypothetical protein